MPAIRATAFSPTSDIPAASEDDAERAIGAGLELALGIETGGKAPEKLGIRVGIATGVVLVGDLLRSHVADNPPVIGETANLAAQAAGTGQTK